MNDKHLRTWFVVFVVAVFMAGIGGGMILDRYVAPLPRLIPMGGGGRRYAQPPPAPNPRAEMERLGRYLELTPEQRAQLDKILADRRTRNEDIRAEMQARFDKEQRDFRETIAKILTPDQRTRFEDWLAREPLPGIRGGRGRRMGPGGMGPGGGMGRGRGPGG
jgi:hypothetical protein